jgi:plasmid maintenance system antidote protein VapI
MLHSNGGSAMTEASEIEVLKAQVQVAEELINWHVRSLGIVHEAMGSPYKGDASKSARDVANLAAEKLRARRGDGIRFAHDPAACAHCKNVAKHTPAHPAEIILDEMRARGWDLNMMVDAMEIADERDRKIALLAFEGYFTVRAPNIVLGERMAELLGKALSVEPRFWLNLHEQWRAAELAVAR